MDPDCFDLILSTWFESVFGEDGCEGPRDREADSGISADLGELKTDRFLLRTPAFSTGEKSLTVCSNGKSRASECLLTEVSGGGTIVYVDINESATETGLSPRTVVRLMFEPLSRLPALATSPSLKPILPTPPDPTRFPAFRTLAFFFETISSGPWEDGDVLETSFSRIYCRAAAIPAVAGMIEPRGSNLGCLKVCKVGVNCTARLADSKAGVSNRGNFAGVDGGRGDVIGSLCLVWVPKIDPICNLSCFLL